MNTSSCDEGNNDKVSADPPTNDVNINGNSNDEKNDFEVTPDTPTNNRNNETIDNHEEKKLRIIFLEGNM